MSADGHRSRQPRTLGILGGMGPGATAYFYRQVIEATPASSDQDHLHVIIDSNAKIPDRTQAVTSGVLEPLLGALQSSVSRLVRAGAEVIAMPCNTAHVVYDELQAACPAEILHLVSATCAEVERLGFAHPALIATRGTLQSGLYQRRFAHTRLLLPDDELVEAIDRQIMEIKAGRYGSANATFRRAVEDLQSKGADCLLLACTDIPLAFDPTDGPLPMLDTCAILARAAVARCLSDPEAPPPEVRSSGAALPVGIPDPDPA